MSRILVVDDEGTSRSLLKDILGAAGYDVVEAEDGRQALDLLSHQSIQLVITDRRMPVLDGLELLKAMQKEKIKIPVLMVSAFGEEKFWGQAIGLGAVDYLVKPFKAEDVLKHVRNYLKPENSQ